MRAGRVLPQFSDSLTGKILPDSLVKLAKEEENVTPDPGDHRSASVIDSSSCDGDRRMFGYAAGFVSFNCRKWKWADANAR
jgi:hypothetical protein